LPWYGLPRSAGRRRTRPLQPQARGPSLATAACAASATTARRRSLPSRAMRATRPSKRAAVWQVDDHDGDTLAALLDDVLAGSRSGASEWSKPGTESDAAHSSTLWTTQPRPG